MKYEMMLLKFSILTIFIVKTIFCVEDGPTVCLDSGQCFQGSWMTTSKGNRFASFQGIRYGQPPTGELRFKSPRPFEYSQNETVIVDGISTIQCPQYEGDDFKGQEDCLFLNIYVPEDAIMDGVEKSVMIWIHGGSLIVGSNSMEVGFKYSPYSLIDNDVILVAANYRLGYLGFLSMGTEDVPGNAGLRDQTMAMRWVQDNIQQFNGNPGSVTIFGESAGSISVSYQLASPLSRGLFQRAIMQSGTSVSPNSRPVGSQPAFRTFKIVAETLNCSTNSDQEALECLQSKDVKDVANHDAFTGADGGMPLPVIDFWSPDGDSFLPYSTDIIFSNGEFNTDLEVMIGKLC